MEDKTIFNSKLEVLKILVVLYDKCLIYREKTEEQKSVIKLTEESIKKLINELVGVYYEEN